jgi:hypothetical protein
MDPVSLLLLGLASPFFLEAELWEREGSSRSITLPIIGNFLQIYINGISKSLTNISTLYVPQILMCKRR